MIRAYFNWWQSLCCLFFKKCIIFSLVTFISIVAFAQQQKKIGSVDELKKYLQLNSVKQLSKSSRLRTIKTNGSDLKAVVNTTKVENGNEIVSGQVEGSQSSNIYFKFSNGKVVGTIVDPKQEKAYKYDSDDLGNVIVSEEDIHNVLCIKYEDATAAAQTAAQDVQAAPPAGSAAYQLQSLPGSLNVVYLDFDGQVVTSSRWNGGNTINAAPANVTDADITAIWKAVSEDYKPFNVNITTDESVFLAAAKGKRMRCIFTPTSSWYGSAGGVAYVNSFAWTDDTPCWAFYFSQKIGAEVGSHEIGHTMGLSHDGRTTPAESYYGGQGIWAPIMGVSYYKSLTQWSKGEYQYANQTQDDVAIISAKVAYKSDDAGNTNATAKALALSSSGSVLATNVGIITTRADIDVYSFTTSGGNISLIVNPASVNPNLDVLLKLTNSSGTVLITADPTNTLSATITTSLAAGTYYLQIDGTGQGDPLTTGYSDYASIGEYTISGTVPVSVTNILPTVSITSPGNGTSYTAPASVTINATASDADGTISKVEFYNGTTLLNTDNTSPYSYSWSGVVAGIYTLTAKAYDNVGGVTTSSAVSITVNPPANQLPTVSITSPVNGTSYTAPASLTINATASDADGTISKVEFYNGSTLLNTDNTSPYSYSWTGIVAGTYTLTAKAYDNSGGITTSSSVTITVTPAVNQLPTVSITSPVNGTSYTAPASVTINATASDADGTISKVEFYNGTTLLGTDNTSPYSYNWANVAAGSYLITAKAFDNLNATRVSAEVSITVTGSSGVCTAPQWNSSIAYWGGDVVQYSGIKYKANWWTQNNRPDLNNGGVGTGQPWTSLGPCTAKMSASELADVDESLSIYPNPGNDKLNVQMNGVFESIEIVGTDGKVYISENENSTIDISSLTSGLYLIKIKYEGNTFVRRFSKQ